MESRKRVLMKRFAEVEPQTQRADLCLLLAYDFLLLLKDPQASGLAYGASIASGIKKH